jgi:hypothetical protein
MKKVIFIVLVSYLFLSMILLIFFDDNNVQEFSIMSIKKHYSRILTPNEIIDVPVYVSENKTFFTDKDNIIDARIFNDNQEMDIEISNIKSADKAINYNNVKYYKYYFSLDFSNNYIKDLYFNLSQAKLNLTYNNDARFDLSIGHIYLLFNDLDQVNMIDFERMYGLFDRTDNAFEDVFSGVYMELMNESNERIIITKIDILNDYLSIDLDEIIELEYEPDINQGPMYFNDDYTYLTNDLSEESSYILNHSKKLILPLKHLNHKQYISRFPIIIHYECLGKDYRLMIDDYKFMSREEDFSIYEASAETHNYQYS